MKKPLNIRLDAAMIEALRLQAEANSLSFAAHIRSQLAAALVRPHDVTRTAREVAR